MGNYTEYLINMKLKVDMLLYPNQQQITQNQQANIV